MSPNNGQLVVGIPLYQRFSYGDNADSPHGIRICIEDDEPLVYAVDCGPELENLHFMNAEWVEENMIFLGEL